TITNTLGVATRYTSYHRDFVFGAFTFVANPALKRGQFPIMGANDVPEMTVELAVLDPIVAAYCGVGITPQRWHIAITRVQAATGDPYPIFAGYVRDCQLQGHSAVFTATAVTGDALEQTIPSVLASRLCQHVLYDGQCGEVRSSNAVITTITINPANPRLLTVASVGAFLAVDDFADGELLHTASGERRTIIAQAGLVMTIDAPLPTTAASGNAVTIFRGCDRAVSTCRSKFSNVPNFGGHPHLVVSSPWLSGADRVTGSGS
ncbi:MAG: phage BR0599 family protein, partial [Pseudolysinimonas sp.]